MALTREGEALLRYCQAVRDLEGETLAKLQAGGTVTEARVRITGPTSIIESRTVPQCLGILAKFPSLLVTFDVNDIEDRCEDLRNGTAQLAIVPRTQVTKELDSKLLKPEHYILVGSPTWRRRTLTDILKNERIIDLDDTDHMTHSYLKKFRLQRFAKVERHFVNNNPALLRFFQSACGYGVLTTDVADPLLKAGTLIDLNPGHSFQNELALAWYPRPEMPTYFRALIAAIS